MTIVEPKTKAELLAAFDEHATVRLTLYTGEGPPKLVTGVISQLGPDDDTANGFIGTIVDGETGESHSSSLGVFA